MNRRLFFSKELRKRIRRDVWIVIPSLTAANAVLFLSWWLGRYALRITPETQRYLYSSLIQAFAALAGLLLTLMGFLYQRIKDGQNVYLEDASREATNLSVGNLPRDYDAIRNRVDTWDTTSHLEQEEKVNNLLSAIKMKYTDPRTAPRSEHEVINLRHESQQLRIDVERYSQIASLLGRVKLLDDYFRTQVSAGSILAVVSTLIVILLSLGLLTSVDHLGGIHAFAVLTTAIVAVFSIGYVVSFFRDMLHVTFGISKIPGFDETGLTRPTDTHRILEEVKKTMGW